MENFQVLVVICLSKGPQDPKESQECQGWMDFKGDQETKESRVCKASQVSKVNVDEMVVMDADEVVMIVECADYQLGSEKDLLLDDQGHQDHRASLACMDRMVNLDGMVVRANLATAI